MDTLGAMCNFQVEQFVLYMSGLFLFGDCRNIRVVPQV